MDVELEPSQPDEVTLAVADLLDADSDDTPPDPWWRAGVDENLDT